MLTNIIATTRSTRRERISSPRGRWKSEGNERSLPVEGKGGMGVKGALGWSGWSRNRKFRNNSWKDSPIHASSQPLRPPLVYAVVVVVVRSTTYSFFVHSLKWWWEMRGRGSWAAHSLVSASFPLLASFRKIHPFTQERKKKKISKRAKNLGGYYQSFRTEDFFFLIFIPQCIYLKHMLTFGCRPCVSMYVRVCIIWYSRKLLAILIQSNNFMLVNEVYRCKNKRM